MLFVVSHYPIFRIFLYLIFVFSIYIRASQLTLVTNFRNLFCLTLSKLRHISKQAMPKRGSSSSSCIRGYVNIHDLMSNYSTRKVAKSNSDTLEARINNIHVSWMLCNSILLFRIFPYLIFVLSICIRAYQLTLVTNLHNVFFFNTVNVETYKQTRSAKARELLFFMHACVLCEYPCSHVQLLYQKSFQVRLEHFRSSNIRRPCLMSRQGNKFQSQ